MATRSPERREVNDMNAELNDLPSVRLAAAAGARLGARGSAGKAPEMHSSAPLSREGRRKTTHTAEPLLAPLDRPRQRGAALDIAPRG
jgi:hypothetical protein